MRWQDLNVELSERRFGLNRSIGEVSRDLGVSRDLLIAFENGDYERMPKVQETRNALASYAGYLGIDTQEVLDAYEEGRNAYENGISADAQPSAEAVEEPGKEPADEPVVDQPDDDAGSAGSEGRRPRRRAFAFVAVAVLLVAVAGAAVAGVRWLRASERDAVVQSLSHVLDAAQKPLDKVEAVIDQYERDKAAPPVDPEVDANIVERARECESETEWLIVVDCANNRMGIFRGAKDAWTNTEFISVSCGADDGRETERGTFAVEDRGYSFNGFDEEFRAYYTCYYWVRFAGPYLIHSQPYHLESFDLMDDRIGQNVSQGCVRLPLEKAKWIYDNIPIGTTVVTF